MISPNIFDSPDVRGMFTTRDLAPRALGLQPGFAGLPAGLAALACAAGIRNIYLPIQRHTDHVVRVGAEVEPVVADAVITNDVGLFIGVQTADCVPVLIFDPVTRAVGAAHAGWRGTAEAILKKTITAMEREFSSAPSDLLIAVGPAIGACCYEVGPEVAEAVSRATGKGDYVTLSYGRPRIDLPDANRLQALSMGVREANIWLSGECTSCLPHRFYSYRYAKGATGRQYALIGLKDDNRML